MKYVSPIAIGALAFLSAAPVGASEAAVPLDVQTLRGCFSEAPSRYAQPDVGIIIPSARNLAAEDRARYERIAAETIAMTCRAGGHLVIRPIRARNMTADTLFSASAPDPHESNPALLIDQRARFVGDALTAARRALAEPGSSKPNDLLSSMYVAAHELSAFSGKRVLVIDYHSWIDKETFGVRDPVGPNDLKRLTNEATSLGLSLDGFDIVVAGLASDARIDPPDRYYVALCRLWRDWAVGQLRGSLVSCGRDVPDFMRIAIAGSPRRGRSA